MATAAPEPSEVKNPLQVADVLADLEAGELHAAAEENRPSRTWILRLVLAVALLAAIGLGVLRLTAPLAAGSAEGLLTHKVGRGELLVSITEDGNLESAQNLDIKCQVAGGSMILAIVDDGKEVQEGEVLVRLESSQLEDQINQQKIVYEKARAAQIQSEKDFAVAKISVQEFLEGTYRQQIQDLAAKVTIAMENLRSAENTLQHTQRMFRKGYVSPLQLETQQFAVERAKLDLSSAETAKLVLEKFTKAKTLQGLESQRDTAEAKKNSDNAALALEEARLKRLEAQLQKCVIKAPTSGMVVYANDQSRGRFGGQQGVDIKEGATVRDQQTLLRLPDLSKMQVKVVVHESKVDRLRRGMRARVRIQDRELQGTVISVANQPEPTSFFSAAVKEYATIVKIDSEAKGLRPGMTAEVEILVDHLRDVLTVPVAAVFERRGQTFCARKKGDSVEARPIRLGQTNDKFVEVIEGAAEGDEVVLNPRSALGEEGKEDRQPEKVDVEKRFGPARPASDSRGPGGPDRAAAAGDRTPAGPAAGEPRPGPGRTQGGPGSSGGPGGDGPGAKSGRARMDLMQFDKNGDKKLSRDELPEQMQGFFDRMDTNRDGFIDQAEIAAARSRMRSAGPPAPTGAPKPPNGP